MNALIRPNALTFVTADCSLAKRTTVIDGIVTRTDDPPWPTIVAFETIDVGSPDDLLDLLSSAADEDPAPCVVRAEPVADMGRRAIHDHAENGPAGMRVVPRAWVGYDIEKVPAGGIDPLHEPEQAVAKTRRCLPPQHHDCTVVWQITASAGKRADELRLRLWFLYDRPMLGKQVEVWCKPGVDSGWLDPCTLRNEVLPHFIGVKVVGNSPDPCRRRWGVVRGERDVVPVPASALVLPERQVDGISLDCAGNLDALKKKYGERVLKIRRRQAVAEIKGAIAAVAKARPKARHPTYYKSAAKVKGLCDYWCLSLDQAKEKLVEADLKTLNDDEARKREKGSTKGVWDWLDARETPNER